MEYLSKKFAKKGEEVSMILEKDLQRKFK